MDDLRDGPELTVIYIGRSTCGWCQRPETQELVREAIDTLRGIAAMRDWVYVTRGISLDRDVSEGIAHLADVSPFDEVGSGGGWLNEGGRELVWERPSAVPATPTVVVLARLRERTSVDGRPVLQVLAERELFRATGLVELTEWKQTGYVIRNPESGLQAAARQLGIR